MVKILAALLLVSASAFGQGFRLTDTAFLGQVWNSSQSSTYDPRVITGLQLWVSADSSVYTDAAKSTPANTGDSVYTWANRSASNTFGDLIQGQSSLRPIFYTTGGINSMPHVHFDAHYLTNASSSVAQPFTIVTVVTTTNVPGGSTGSIFVEKNFNVTVNISRANFIAGGFPTVAAGGAGQTLTKAIGTSASVGGLILSYFSGTSSDAEINSTNAWTGGNPGTSAMVNPQMGGSSVFGSTYNWQGEIYELMFFNKNLSTTERSNVTYYLKHKYNLPANNVQ